MLNPHHPALGLRCAVHQRAAMYLWEWTSTGKMIVRSPLVSGWRVRVFCHASPPTGEAPCKHLQGHLISSLPNVSLMLLLGRRSSGAGGEPGSPPGRLTCSDTAFPRRMGVAAASCLADCLPVGAVFCSAGAVAGTTGSRRSIFKYCHHANGKAHPHFPSNRAAGLEPPPQ